MTSLIIKRFCGRSGFLILNINSKCLQTTVFSNMHFRKLKKLERSPLLSTTTSLLNIQQSAMMSGEGIKVIDFEGVKGLKNEKSVLLVDVREPKELQETGVLPNSVNIPLGKLEDALKNLSDNNFKKLYGRSKPSLDYTLVFSCKTGGRSQKAAELALKLGYTDISNYSGGWTDWEKNTKS